MPAIRFLRTHLQTTCPTIHATRLTALLSAVEALLHHPRLPLTELGRALRRPALVKHNIKRMDRLLGNSQLHGERVALYTALTQWLQGKVTAPLIVVDWSPLTSDQPWQLLRASLPVHGRALTIYEEVHPRKSLTNRRVHRAFLRHLRAVLPATVRPILVTDAGFRGTWFRLVEEGGWEWVGRIRNRTLMQREGTTTWQPCKTLYAKATTRPTTLGPVQLVRSNPLRCVLHVVRQVPKGRVHKSVFGTPRRGWPSRKMAVRAREPWLLASSASLQAQTATRIVTIYRTRMQIEEAFRDLKSQRYGLGFSASQTRIAERFAILWLIGALTLFVLWLVGQVAIQQQWQFRYQSNTRRRQAVLSMVTLGRCVLRRAAEVITKAQMVSAFADLQAQLLKTNEG
ncbi:IS4 family transposase [Candidatus Nitrospira salsa]